MKHFKQSMLAGFVALLVLLVGCGSDSSSSPGSPSNSGSHNAADVTFASGMIPHHAQAIQMAEMAIDSAMDADLITLARQIKAAQSPEIDTMSGWLRAWGEPVPDTSMVSMSGMDHGDVTGMMSSRDLAHLRKAEGSGFDAMWLDMMVNHHEGAVDMARTEVADGDNPAAQQLARDIITAQQREIRQMNAMMAR